MIVRRSIRLSSHSTLHTEFTADEKNMRKTQDNIRQRPISSSSFYELIDSRCAIAIAIQVRAEK